MGGVIYTGGWCSGCNSWPCRCASVSIPSVWIQPQDFRHDEMLRLQCLEKALSDVQSAERRPHAMTVGGWSPPETRILDEAVLKLARRMFYELTGRDWPTWNKPEAA